MRVTMTLSLPRQPSSVTRARQILATLLSLTDASEEARGHLAVLISEACANAVVHAERDSAVDVTIRIDDHECLIEVGNRGSAPAGVGTGLARQLPDPLTVGGRGLPLIAALADTATFVAGRSGDVLLRMTKRLAATPGSTTSVAASPGGDGNFGRRSRPGTDRRRSDADPFYAVLFLGGCESRRVG